MLHIGPFTIQSNVLQAGAIILLVFILVLVMAYMSRNFMSWSLSGAWVGLVVGIGLTLILEGFLLVGGKTVLISLLGIKNAPKPIQNMLDSGHKELLDALQVPASCSASSK